MKANRAIAAASALLVLSAASARAQAPPPRASDGTIVTAAGTTAGFAGDGGPATQAKLDIPRDIARGADGALLIADFNNDRVRAIAPNGTIDTVAGNGTSGFQGDNGPATSAALNRPRGVTALPGGGYLVADTFNDRIRRVAPDGTITTIAGGGSAIGDGGAAASARLTQPSDTVLLPGGGYLIADTGAGRIRRVDANGTITTIAGTTPGFGGDGAPATSAQLNQPRDVAIASDGAILVADTANNRIRRIGAAGMITTVAGGSAGFAGDGEPARNARLSQPYSVEALTNGGFLFADTANDRVRRVTPLGAIFTVAGIGAGLAGDGGQAKAARLAQPGAVALDGSGGFFVADTANARIRRVSALGAIPGAVVGRSFYVYPAALGPTVAAQPLLEEDLVPVSSPVDATSGRIEVRTAFDDHGAQQTAEIYSGPFTLRQAGPRSAPVTLFRLPSLDGCAAEARGGAPRAVAAKAKKRRRARRSRRIWVTEKGGRWRTSTGSVSAAAVGTAWVTTLQCDGTRVTVREGRVAVRDKIRGITKVVSAGGSVKVRAAGGN